MSLRCKVCDKEFPEFDQRGFRNAGFTAHQNRCVSRVNAAAAAMSGAAPGTDGSDTVSASTSRRPSHPRRLLPAPPRTSSSAILSSPPPTVMSPPLSVDHHHLEFQQHQHLIDFFPVLQCNYCIPQQGFHDPSCIFFQFILDLTSNNAPPLHDPLSPSSTTHK